MRVHPGTMVAGLIFLVTGVAFVMEALGMWTLALSDLRLVGPLALVLAGVAVVITAWARPTDKAT